jgi:hypothetical protein
MYLFKLHRSTATTNPSWEMVNHTTYLLSNTSVDHNLDSSTTFVLISCIGPVYIDFDSESPDPSTAPMFYEDEIVFLPISNISTINLMGEPNSQALIMEYK